MFIFILLHLPYVTVELAHPMIFVLFALFIVATIYYLLPVLRNYKAPKRRRRCSSRRNRFLRWRRRRLHYHLNVGDSVGVTALLYWPLTCWPMFLRVTRFVLSAFGSGI